MIRMKNVTVTVGNDLDADFSFLKIGDITVSWQPQYGIWLLDIGAGAKQTVLNDGDIMYVFITTVLEQFK